MLVVNLNIVIQSRVIVIIIVIIIITSVVILRVSLVKIRTVSRRGGLLEDNEERPPLVQKNKKREWLTELYAVHCKLRFTINQQ